MLILRTRIIRQLLSILSALIILLTIACLQEENYDKPELCDNEWNPNISLFELKSHYQGETILIQEDWVVKAYVISSDKEGNFFGSLHIQDHPNNPSSGIEILIDLPDTHLFFPHGRAILIRLKGMYLGMNRGNFQLGGVYSFFENPKVARLPRNLLDLHLKLSCEQSITVLPKLVSLKGINAEESNTYVEIDSVQFSEDLIGEPFADPEEETIRQLEDCNGNTIDLLNSGYAEFADFSLPGGSGGIRGILLKDGDNIRIHINQFSDLKFNYERCPTGPDPISSDSLLISEIADPDNNSEARFIELFNSGSEELNLLGWKLERYTNANLQTSSEIDLSELSISAKGTIIIASNANVFEEVFGFPPNIEGGKNSPADSNGDDNLVLRDPFGAIKDVFGRIGEDGSNTDHEFEDGKALRKMQINRGSVNYNPSEWILYNDSGLAGTINQPQQAPADFSPGKR